MTNRIEPKFEWFVDSFLRECISQNFFDYQLIFIDSRLWYDGEARRNRLSGIVAGRCKYEHVPPKPNIWQGPDRLTTQDYFAASNARNTGALMAKGDYIVFVDDLSVLLPRWLEQVLHAKQHGYCVAGAYKKVKNLNISNGTVLSFDEFAQGVDSRWRIGSDRGIVPIDAGGLFGCSHGVPMFFVCQTNGFDEVCDGLGSEDYDFGIRLGKAGCKIFYNRNMVTYESEELHYQLPVAKRIIKKVGNTDQSHILLQRVLQEPRITTIGNYYHFGELRQKILQGEEFPKILEPKHHWPDGQPLSEM
jgi:hypothetical protein